ncbi:MAG: hypothetical protein EON59_01910 [Alphaproteobacteria bacterium]|nr:MAG: hypothetical protein EON59_01910 [Alphaproteobacteria bacterium]
MGMSVDVAGTGFTVLDRVYSDSEPRFQALGGSCGNVLISLAMLDRRVAPVLSLGEDSVGDDLVSEFAEAGALTTWIFQHAGRQSPVLAQLLDSQSGQHSFSFVCPETDAQYPPYSPIERDEAQRAEPAFDGCQVFYTDRVSDGILDAMERAAASGAVVYFEPSAVGDPALFRRALALCKILKISADRLRTPGWAECLRADAISIVTRGAEGLDVWQGSSRPLHCVPTPAPVVRDTCGSGDMVSVGLIDYILSRPSGFSPRLDDLVEGVIAGQRLAAANCAFSGARGLFRLHGGAVARRVLADPSFQVDVQLDLL